MTSVSLSSASHLHLPPFSSDSTTCKASFSFVPSFPPPDRSCPTDTRLPSAFLFSTARPRRRPRLGRGHHLNHPRQLYRLDRLGPDCVPLHRDPHRRFRRAARHRLGQSAVLGCRTRGRRGNQGRIGRGEPSSPFFFSLRTALRYPSADSDKLIALLSTSSPKSVASNRTAPRGSGPRTAGPSSARSTSISPLRRPPIPVVQAKQRTRTRRRMWMWRRW